MTRDERNPFTDERDLPIPEVGDLGSFEREPDFGDDEPERVPDVARVDLTADEPGPDTVDIDLELTDDEAPA